MLNHASSLGATIIVKLNGVERFSLTLPEDEQLVIRAKTFTYLVPGDTVEYIENGESKVFTVPAGKIMLVEWERNKIKGI